MRLSIIDIETGGLQVKYHGITQVSILKGQILPSPQTGILTFRPGNLFNRYVIPDEEMYEYEEDALKYQGFTSHSEGIAFLKEQGIVEDQLRGEITQFLEGYEPFEIWAQEDTFDYNFLHHAFDSVDPWLPKRAAWNCSKRLVRLCRFLDLYHGKSDSLKDVTEFLQLCKINEVQMFQGRIGSKSIIDIHFTGYVIANMIERLYNRGQFEGNETHT